MQHNISMTYKLQGKGWAVYTLSVGDCTFVTTASWLDDALKDLTNALVDLFLITSSCANLIEEPHTHRYVFERDETNLNIRVLFVDNIRCNDWSNSTGVSIWSAECSFADFVTIFIEMTNTVLQEYGEDGYKKIWHGDFPTESVDRLVALSKTLN